LMVGGLNVQNRWQGQNDTGKWSIQWAFNSIW